MIVLNRVRALSTKQKVIAGVSAAVVVAAGVGIGVAATQNTSSRPVAASASLDADAYAAVERDADAQTEAQAQAQAGAGPPTRSPGSGRRQLAPVIAVKIDDTFNGRPQLGSTRRTSCTSSRWRPGLTRLLAIFASKRPVVEPVRSVRASDPELLTQYGPIVDCRLRRRGRLAASGQPLDHSRGVRWRPGLRARFRPQRSVQPDAESRRVLAAAFRTAGKAKSIGFTWSATVPSGAARRAAVDRSGRPSEGPTARSSVSTTTRQSKRYVRVIDGARQTAADGAAISTPNVIIQVLRRHRESGRR